MERREIVALLAVVSVFFAMLAAVLVNRDVLSATMVSEHVFDYPTRGRCAVITYREGYKDETLDIRPVVCNEVTPPGVDRERVLRLNP